MPINLRELNNLINGLSRHSLMGYTAIAAIVAFIVLLLLLYLSWRFLLRPVWNWFFSVKAAPEVKVVAPLPGSTTNFGRAFALIDCLLAVIAEITDPKPAGREGEFPEPLKDAAVLLKSWLVQWKKFLQLEVNKDKTLGAESERALIARFVLEVSAQSISLAQSLVDAARAKGNSQIAAKALQLLAAIRTSFDNLLFTGQQAEEYLEGVIDSLVPEPEQELGAIVVVTNRDQLPALTAAPAPTNGSLPSRNGDEPHRRLLWSGWRTVGTGPKE